MIVREFLTRLAFNADDRKVQRFDRAVRVLRTSLLAVVGAATAASAAAFTLATGTAQYGDELAKTARRLGINVDALERLRFAAERSGVAQNTLEMALQRMTRRLSEAAAGGGEAQKAIQELGLDAQALGNMNPEEAMLVLADALEGVENQSERVRLAFKFFDSEGVALLNMLDGGSEKVRGLGDEFERLGGGLTGKQAAAAEAFTDAMTDMQTTFANLRLQIGAKLMPIFKPLIEQFTEFLVINRELILERIHRTFEILIGVMRSLMRIAGRVWDVVDGLAQAFGGWENTLKLVAGAASALVAIKVVKWLNAIKNALTIAAVARFGGWALAIGGLVFALDELAAFMRGDSSYLTDLSNWLQEMGAAEGVADGITKLGGALASLLAGAAVLRLAGFGFALSSMAVGVRAIASALGVLGTTAGVSAGLGFLKKLSRLGPLAAIPFLGGGAEIPKDENGNPKLDDSVNPETGFPKGSLMDRFYNREEPEPSTGSSGRRDRRGSDLDLDGVRRFFDPANAQMMPAMAPGAGVTNNSSVVNLDAEINVTVPPGSNNEQAEFIASSVRAEIEREVNRAGTALET